MRRRRCRTKSKSISSELEDQSALVRFIFAGKTDLRTFRDEKGYVVDVVKPDSNTAAPGKPAAAKQGAAPDTVPAAKPATEGAAGAAVAPAARIETPNAVALAATMRRARTAETAAAIAGARPSGAAPGASRCPRCGKARGARIDRGCAGRGTGTRRFVRSGEARSRREAAGKATAANVAKADAPAPVAAPQSNPQSTPVAAPPPAAAAAPAEAPAAPRRDTLAKGKVAVELSRQGGDLKLTFPFKTPSGAAVFQRADTLWIVFDSKADIDLSALDGEPSRTIR